MGAILSWLIATGIVTLIGYSLSPESFDVNATKASNCDRLFRTFEAKLFISESKIKKLQDAKEELKGILKPYCKNHKSLTVPSFRIQGSYKMGTLIKTQDNRCDIDLGVYFFTEPQIKNKTIFNNLKKALEESKLEKAVILKEKCIRVNYSSGFHIDLPLYYFDKEEQEPYLLTKDGGYEISDPKRVWEWFEKKKTNNNRQVFRLVKYFKAWADFQKNTKGRKMPSGLALSVWAAGSEIFSRHDRDDVALFRTALNLYSSLSDIDVDEWRCELPVYPFDDLIAKLNLHQRKNFLKTLKEFLGKAGSAISSNSKGDAIKHWKVLFGKRFPQRS
jgi:hypothetical protein